MLQLKQTQTNQKLMVKDLKLFQACKQMFLKQFIKRKLGVHSPTISLPEHAYIVWLSKGSNNLHSIFRLRA